LLHVSLKLQFEIQEKTFRQIAKDFSFKNPLISLHQSFKKLGSATSCHVFGEAEVRNDGRVLLVVLNLYVQIKIRVVTFDTNSSVPDGTQSIAASIQNFSDFQATHRVDFAGIPGTEQACLEKVFPISKRRYQLDPKSTPNLNRGFGLCYAVK
jgi:hypothetical protein